MMMTTTMAPSTTPHTQSLEPPLALQPEQLHNRRHVLPGVPRRDRLLLFQRTQLRNPPLLLHLHRGHRPRAKTVPRLASTP